MAANTKTRENSPSLIEHPSRFRERDSPALWKLQSTSKWKINRRTSPRVTRRKSNASTQKYHIIFPSMKPSMGGWERKFQTSNRVWLDRSLLEVSDCSPGKFDDVKSEKSYAPNSCSMQSFLSRKICGNVTAYFSNLISPRDFCRVNFTPFINKEESILRMCGIDCKRRFMDVSFLFQRTYRENIAHNFSRRHHQTSSPRQRHGSLKSDSLP